MNSGTVPSVKKFTVTEDEKSSLVVGLSKRFQGSDFLWLCSLVMALRHLGLVALDRRLKRFYGVFYHIEARACAEIFYRSFAETFVAGFSQHLDGISKK